MRHDFSRRVRFIVCAALAAVLVMLMQGVSRSQEDVAATDAAPDADAAAQDAETAPDAATDAVPGAEGEEAKETAEEVLKRGQEALQKGDLQAAYTAFDQLARGGERGEASFDPRAAQLRLVGYTGRGQALVGMKEYDAAVEEFKQALELEPNFLAALLARGRMYLDIGNPENYSAALSDFQNAVKVQRGNILAQYGLGEALILTNNFNAGIAPLTKVIAAFEADTENAEALRIQLAKAYRLRGMGYSSVYKLNEGIEDLNKSLALNPDDHETYLTLGAIAFRLEEYQEAVDQLGKAIEYYKPKDPEDKLPYVQGLLTRTSAYMELGKNSKDPQQRAAAYEAAKREVEKVLLPLDPKNPYMGSIRSQALYWRAIAERMAGQLEKAVQTFSEAIELNPDFSEAYYRRGICYHYLGDDRLAIADFTEASNINFNDPRSALWLGFTHAKMGSYLDALRAYNDAISVSDRFTPAYLNRGLTYMSLGEYDKALADFNDAVRLEPTNPDYYFKRGLAYEALGQYEKAAESFGDAIEFNDKHAAAYRHLSVAMQRLGRTELARQYGQRAAVLESQQKPK